MIINELNLISFGKFENEILDLFSPCLYTKEKLQLVFSKCIPLLTEVFKSASMSFPSKGLMVLKPIRSVFFS